MNEASTSNENCFEPISSIDQDPNTIVEAVYENELLSSDDKSRLSSVIQKKSHRSPLNTDIHHRYKCPLCERGFQNVGPLKCHYGKAHRNSGPFMFLFDSSLVCNICNKSCEQKAEFDLHLQSHIKKNEIEPIVKSYQCDVCHMCFPWKSALENHYFSHNNEPIYACDICKSNFLEVEQLKEHYLQHSEGQTENNCIKCSDKPSCACGKKAFSKKKIKKDLQSHYATHTKKKPFKCDVCSTGFSSQLNLKRHADVHTNEKPFEGFECEVCKKSFRLLGSLKQHCITHTKERPYQCAVCNRSFSRKSTLEAHERTHNNDRPFVCELCNKRFRQRSCLQAHCFVHTHEKPFQCDLCNKCFSLRSKLKAHQLFHKEKQPHSNKIL